MEIKINQLERNLPAEDVFTVHFSLIETDADDNSASINATMNFTADPESPDFKPFDSLTEADVIGWVSEAIGAETLAAHEANLQARISEQVNPTTATGCPWNQAA